MLKQLSSFKVGKFLQDLPWSNSMLDARMGLYGTVSINLERYSKIVSHIKLLYREKFAPN